MNRLKRLGILWFLGLAPAWGGTLSVSGGESVSLMSENVTLMGDLIVSSGSVNAGSSRINLSGDWDLRGGVFNAGTSTVTFNGAVASTSTILGNTTFYIFQSTTPSKVLIFESGSTTTVAGVFNIRGAAGQLLLVRSSTPTIESYLVNSGSNVVSYTNPRDNHAGGGNAIQAGPTSFDGGNTVNWFFVALSSATPKTPGGVLATVSGTDLNVTWNTVTQDVNNNAVLVSSYSITCSTEIGAPPSISTSVVYPSTSVVITNINPPQVYCRVVANPYAGSPSAPTDYVDTSVAQNRISVDPSDTTGLTRLVMPRTLALELRMQNNGDDDFYIEWTNNSAVAPSLEDVTLRARRLSDNAEITNFTFSSAGTTLQLNYTGTSTDEAGIYAASNVSVPLSTLAPANSGPFVASITALGRYQLRTAQAGTGFRLINGSPYPRVMTPNASDNRRIFWFYANPSGDTVEGKIYDIRGAIVRNLAVSSQSPTATSLVWDGRSDGGSVVPTGVYLYKITSGKQSVSGTVVVAR